MATGLDRLLETIDPSRILDIVSADVDRAVNSFSMQHATIDNLDEYEQFLADFFHHVQVTVLKMKKSFPEYRDIHWTQCSKILSDEFGPSGWKTAFEMVRTGKNGGLYRVLKVIAAKMTENYAQNEISARINHYLNNLSIDEKLSAANEYLNKYGHLLPSEFTGGNGALLKTNFGKVLEEHPKTIRRMRRIGR